MRKKDTANSFSNMSTVNQNTRLKSYKNKGLDAEELRRRREEEGVQLRKAKREEHVRYLIFVIHSFIHCVRNIIFEWLKSLSSVDISRSYILLLLM